MMIQEPSCYHANVPLVLRETLTDGQIFSLKMSTPGDAVLRPDEWPMEM